MSERDHKEGKNDEPVDESQGDNANASGDPPKRKRKTAAELKEEERERRRDEESRMLAEWQRFNREGWDRNAPEWPTEKDREQVKVFTFAGFTQEQIASAGGVSVEVLKQYFSYELEHARMMIIGDLAARAIYRAREGDAAYTLFLLKTRGGFHENPRGPNAAIEELKQEGVLTSEQADELSKSIVSKIKIANRVLREKRAEDEKTAKDGERSEAVH